MQAQLAVDPHPRAQVQVGAEQQAAQAVDVGRSAADAETRRVERIHPQAGLAAQRQIGVRPQWDVAQTVQARARLVRQIGVALVRPDKLEGRRISGMADATNDESGGQGKGGGLELHAELPVGDGPAERPGSRRLRSGCTTSPAR